MLTVIFAAVVVIALINGINSIVGIFVILAFIFLILASILFTVKDVIIGSYCASCNLPLYGCEYGYDDVGKTYHESTRSSEAYITKKVQIWWRCPYCDKRHTINKSYRLNGASIQHKVDEYCRKHFRNEKHRNLDQ